MIKKRILVVDDETEIRFILRQFLTPTYEIMEAENGEAALKFLKAQTFDVVVTDYRMPLLDGVGLIRALHEISAATPVILLTGTATKEIDLKSLGLNIFQYIEKPFDIEEVTLAVANALKGS